LTEGRAVAHPDVHVDSSYPAHVAGTIGGACRTFLDGARLFASELA
jgi:hypothetical protein